MAKKRKEGKCGCTEDVEQTIRAVLLAGFTRWVNDHPEENFTEAFENFMDFADWEWSGDIEKLAN
jgi:hypothetical protein